MAGTRFQIGLATPDESFLPVGGFLPPKKSGSSKALDADLEMMSRLQLVSEVKRLRAGIRAHRDSTRHELCWHHPRLWGLLPEKTDPLPTVPAWPQFLEGCIRYRKALDMEAKDAPRTSKPYQGK